MKNLLLTIALVIAGSAANATSILPPNIPVLSCSNQQGINVYIANYQGIGVAAQVSQRPVVKPGQMTPHYVRLLKQVTPVTYRQQGMMEYYTGQGFNLSITMESFAATTSHYATLKLVTEQGQPFSTGVFCQALR